MSPEACECGLAYVRGHPEDEKRHRVVHAEYRSGPLIKKLIDLRSVGRIGELQVLVADRDTAPATRKAVAKVALVARRGTEYKTGYDGSITDEDPRLYVVAKGQRAVGMALIATTMRSWPLRWISTSHACLQSRQASSDARPVVGRLWTAADYRQKGIASALFDCIVNAERVARKEFCWQLPFTPAGLRIARRLTDQNWYGEGDRFDFEDLLAPEADCGEPLPPPTSESSP